MNKLCLIERDFKVELGESIIRSGVHYYGLDFDFITTPYSVSLSQTDPRCQLNHQLRVSASTGRFLRPAPEVS